jgi:hypothetical protein
MRRLLHGIAAGIESTCDGPTLEDLTVLAKPQRMDQDKV